MATGRVITASVIVCVFGALVTGSPLRILDVSGFGVAVVVPVDATLVRTGFVPSVLQLPGRASWLLPGWPERRLPRPQAA